MTQTVHRTPFNQGLHQPPLVAKTYQWPQGYPQRNKGQGGEGTTETSFTTGVAQDKPPLTKEEMLRQEVQQQFPHVSWAELEFRYKEAARSGGLIIEVKYHSAKDSTWMPLLTKSRGDVDKTLNQSLANRVKDALGKPAPPSKDAVDEEIAATNRALQEQETQEAAQLKALHQAQTKADEAQRLRREMDAIRKRTKDAEYRMQELEDTQGPLDKVSIQKLKDEKRKLAADHQAKRKQLDALAQAAQQAQKLQQDINKTRLNKGETERRLGQLKAQKTLYNPLMSSSKRLLSLMNTLPKTYAS